MLIYGSIFSRGHVLFLIGQAGNPSIPDHRKWGKNHPLTHKFQEAASWPIGTNGEKLPPGRCWYSAGYTWKVIRKPEGQEKHWFQMPRAMKTCSKSSFRAWIWTSKMMRRWTKNPRWSPSRKICRAIHAAAWLLVQNISQVSNCFSHLKGVAWMVNWSHGNQEIPRSMGFYCESPWALRLWGYNLNHTHLVVNLCASYHLVNSSCSSNWLPIVTGRWINDTTIAAPSTSGRPAWFVSVRSAVFSDARVA